jgi:diamine N-acetyltransferase
MAEVHLRPVTLDNDLECLNLQVEESQTRFIATNAKSLAEAKVNSTLVPLAIYDRAARGYPTPTVPMVGFVMYEVTCGVGFILRLMIDRRYQRQGYGRAALVEVIRRLKRTPEVEMIATSHRHDNVAVAHLFQSVGFVPWEVEGAEEGNPGEVFLQLPDGG